MKLAAAYLLYESCINVNAQHALRLELLSDGQSQHSSIAANV
jgi:hypothetical protein